MGNIIVVANSKGGAGKTTIAVNLVTYQSDLGHKVALIDADYNQLSAADWLGRMDHQVNVFSLTSEQEENQRNRELRRLIARIRDDFDYVVVDTKGEAAATTDQALLLADLVLIPFQPSGLDYWRLQDTLDAVAFSQEQNAGRPAAWLILNQTSDRDLVGNKIRDELKTSGIPIATHTLNAVNAYRDAPQLGTVTTRRKDKAGRKHAQAMIALFREVLQPLNQTNQKRVVND